MNPLSDLIYGIRAVLSAGVDVAVRRGLNFGSGFTLTDNPQADYQTVSVDLATITVRMSSHAALLADHAGTAVAWGKIANENVSSTAAISQSKIDQAVSTVATSSVDYTAPISVRVVICQGANETVNIPAPDTAGAGPITIKRDAGDNAPAGTTTIVPASGCIETDSTSIALSNAGASVTLVPCGQVWHKIAEVIGTGA